jgi:hypothetical protein
MEREINTPEISELENDLKWQVEIRKCYRFVWLSMVIST